MGSFSLYVVGCPTLSERPIKMQYSIDTPVQKPVSPPEKLWEAESASLQKEFRSCVKVEVAVLGFPS